MDAAMTEKGPHMPQDRKWTYVGSMDPRVFARLTAAAWEDLKRQVLEHAERQRLAITYPFESDIERATREAQAALWDPQAIIDGKGPPRCHKLIPGSESVAYCGRTFGPGTRQPLPTPPGAYLCRVCLRLNGGPW